MKERNWNETSVATKFVPIEGNSLEIIPIRGSSLSLLSPSHLGEETRTT